MFSLTLSFKCIIISSGEYLWWTLRGVLVVILFPVELEKKIESSNVVPKSREESVEYKERSKEHSIVNPVVVNAMQSVLIL